MPKRLVKKGITVVRDGQRVRPEVGKLFDLTKEEIDGLKEADPAALGPASEADSEEGTATVASNSKPSSAEASQAGAKGGKKAATATTENKDAGKAAKASGGKAGAESADDDL